MSNNQDAEHIEKGASVDHWMLPLKDFMADPSITEICVNRPQEVYVESNGKWIQHTVTALSFKHCRSLATAVARYANNDINELVPILSAKMPHGERIQVVMPPACEDGTISITIRKPSFTLKSLDEYEGAGYFKHVPELSGFKFPVEETAPEITVETHLPDSEHLRDLPPPLPKSAIPSHWNNYDQELMVLAQKGEWRKFLELAVKYEKVIVIAGGTGSGKTTFMKSLMQVIPEQQRLISIEDVPELFMPNHPNHVHLYYPSSSGKNESTVTAQGLLKSCLRMKPDRILLAELRGDETFDFINVALSGHSGSITSCHAGNSAGTFERLAMMCMQHQSVAGLPYSVVKNLLYMAVDIVVCVDNDKYRGKGRHITEIWFNPEMKNGSAH
ncbi:ATPase, T2SS/T4P/T4SS family [Iodobacter fluviatilis]|uniref:P-type DNA transfer ATPase VirB11 n=1 Tax=Iodobacter fluviatilis TaxID=537 RepID=A0A7G3GEL9_9NEIS|nr:ATPase, T2SS/T4P/T4SS family [Iodobacter fluviatilis]QBC45844.1 P-type DNA transfer ATPase VirB11 [Iodobacter fluviatilis]QBC45897.1 P-type DNA transfer ATPase VirB11 [Iodobacter fluviatilis]